VKAHAVAGHDAPCPLQRMSPSLIVDLSETGMVLLSGLDDGRLLFGLLATQGLLPRAGHLEDHVAEPMRAGLSRRDGQDHAWYTPGRGGTP
jgi:hypothetical protein